MKKANGQMQVITINIPRALLHTFEKMIEAGLYPSRSETIRACIYRGVPGMIEEWNEFIGISTKTDPMKQEEDVEDDYVRVPIDTSCEKYQTFKILRRLE